MAFSQRQCVSRQFSQVALGSKLTVHMNFIYGINPVTEALKVRGRALEWVGVTKERHDLRLQRLVEDCRKQGVAVRFLTRNEIDRMTHVTSHQGVLAVTSAKQYND